MTMADPIADLVARGIERCQHLFQELESSKWWAKLERIPGPTIWVGFGRSGKDFGAEHFARITQTVYGGSTSSAMAPFVAAALGVSTEEAFANRHQHRDFWRRFGDRLRKDDPAILGKLCLAVGDSIVGVRARVELDAIRSIPGMGPVIWVDRPGCPHDATVDFTAMDADVVIRNDGGCGYLRRIEALARLVA